jgi:hypothetical protein
VQGTYNVVDPAFTSCGSAATYCWPQTGGEDFNLDAIWIMGWLYARTGIQQYQTWGDELFSSTYGGPAGGAGSGTACGGPNCNNASPGVGFEDPSYVNALTSCNIVSVIPCNAYANYCESGPSSPGYPYCNGFQYFPKGYNQGTGIGGADNYLAWRQTAFGAVQSGAMSSSGSSVQ